MAGLATVNYTFSRNKADATYDNSAIDDPQNPLDKDAEFAAARTDRTQIFTASYVYELPFARGADGRLAEGSVGRVADRRDHQDRIRSGRSTSGRAIVITRSGVSQRAAAQSSRRPGAGDQTGLLWFNPAAFVPSPAGEYGNAPVAPFRLPGRHQWDIAFSKNVNLGGTTRLQFRADLINAFNQTQFLDVEHTVCRDDDVRPARHSARSRARGRLAKSSSASD